LINHHIEKTNIDCNLLKVEKDNIWRDSEYVYKLLEGLYNGSINKPNSYLKRNGVKRWYK